MTVRHAFSFRFALCLAALWLLMPSARAMVINIVAGPNLQSNAGALAAFDRAATAWETLFTNPITITIDADLSSNFPSNNIIGSTDAVTLQASYNAIESVLAGDVASQPGGSIAADLPNASQLSVELPTGFTLSPDMAATKADLKAMGFTGLDNQFGAADATITFNSNFDFYYGTGTFQSGEIDFQTVAEHEIGHVLGFDSAVDTVDTDLHNNTTEAIEMMPLDLYRFAANGLPTSAAAFTSDPRDLLTNSAADLSDTVNNYAMSTGYYTGDKNQASHWKDDALTGQYIGIMDPTLAPNTVESITSADIRAMELIGYDSVAPEPTLWISVAAALGIMVRLRRGARPRA